MKTLHTIYSTFAKHNMAKFLTVLTLLFTVGIGQAWAGEATLAFDNTSKRTVNTKTQQVWEENGIVFTYNQHEYTQDLADYCNPIRLYAKTSATIECTHGNITKIEVTCSSASYATALKNSVGSAATATASGSVVTIAPIASSTTYSITSFTAQTRVNSITVTYQDAAPAFIITAVSNSESYGTVSLTSTTITATPKTGYRVSTSNPYEVTVGTATVVDNDNNTFTVTPESDCTVQINFEAIPTHKVYFNTGGLVDIESVDVQEGATYNITQTPASSLTQECEYNTFVGWTESNTIANPSSKPTIVNSIKMGSSDITLYAVYSKTEGGGGSAAEQGTTMFSENWTGCENNKQPTQPTSDGSVVYNAATITYEWKSSGSTSQTYTSGGPNDNENILISKSNGYWKVVGIPTGQAETLTLSSSKSGSGVLSISTSTSNVSISGSTITIGSSSVNTFDLIFTNTNSSSNLRLDDISVVVAKAGATGTTTYSLTPNCTTTQTANYTVNHYQQNIADDNYTLKETQTLSGEVGTSVTPDVKTYTGFTAPTTATTVTIVADGKTVVEYYYTRNSYTLTWNLDGGTITTAGTPEGAVKYEASLTAPVVEKDGFNFKGWSPSVPTTMPAADTTYTAQWKKKYTIKWIVNGDTDTPYATTYVVDGDALVLPSNPDAPSTCEEKVFIGWTEAAIIGKLKSPLLQNERCIFSN